MKRALSGPAAAGLLGWEGFAEHKWRSLWAVSAGSRKPGPDVIRTKTTLESQWVGDLEIAHPITILRHLGEMESDLSNRPDGITARDRIEIALEYTLREGIVRLDELRQECRRGRTRGDQLLQEVLRLRGDEPPAESIREVFMIQALRSWGITAWRQVPVFENGRYKHRIDLVIPFDPRAKRPVVMLADSGLAVEVDSRKWHVDRFEEDHQRQTTYDMLGIHWIAFTPTQLERSPNRVRKAIESRFALACLAQGIQCLAQAPNSTVKHAS